MDLGKLIPHFFYDMISRVLPGGVALIGVSRAVGETPGTLLNGIFLGAAALQNSALFLSLTFLILSYISGQLIAPLSHSFEVRLVGRILRRFNIREEVLVSAVSEDEAECPRRIRDFILREIGCDCDEKALADLERFHATEIFVWFDWLQFYRPEVGARLAKHRAEYRMFGGFAVASLIAIIVHSILALFDPTVFNRGVLVPTCAFLLSVVGMVRMKLIFNWEVLHYYYVAKSRQPKSAEELVDGTIATAD